MFCSNCGGQVPESDRFCNKCGTPVKAAGGPSMPPPASGQPWAPPRAAGAYPAPPQSFPPQPPPVFPPPPPPPQAYQAPAAFPPPPQQQYAPPQQQYAPPQQQYAPPQQQYAPPQQQYAPPQQQYAPPSAAPYGGAPYAAPQPMAGGPVPPSLHWALVLILSCFTGGIFQMIWMFREASFVKKIDPSSKAVLLLVLSLLMAFLAVAVLLGTVGLAALSGDPSALAAGAAGATLLILLLAPVAGILNLIAFFGMRSSLLRYYNTVEPINLRLSGVMTFFFNILYFQYHFSRIAEWKRTGVLTS